MSKRDEMRRAAGQDVELMAQIDTLSRALEDALVRAITDLTHVISCPENSPASAHVGRVWSLWDMLRVNADQFVDAAQFLTKIRLIAEHIAHQQSPRSRRMTTSERAASGLDRELQALRSHCERLDMRITIKHIDRCVATELTPDDVSIYALEIFERFRDELSERHFYSIRPRHADVYENPLVGWETVVGRFRCDFDIEEARKCLALERYTAAVFHLMKVLEAAVLQLQMFLKEKDVKAHFGSVLSKLEDMTQKQKFEHIKDELKPYLGFLREVLTQLHAVKDSWRNKVSHVDERIVPVDTFTEELAIGVHDAVLLLMKKLAAGLPNPASASAP